MSPNVGMVANSPRIAWSVSERYLVTNQHSLLRKLEGPGRGVPPTEAPRPNNEPREAQFSPTRRDQVSHFWQYGGTEATA